jgi:enoyl-CoA hydratase
MSEEIVTIEREGPIAIVRIDRQASLNALNYEVFERMTATFKDFVWDKTIRVIILTGAGDRSFVAGADIGVMKDMGLDDVRIFLRQGNEMCNAIEAVPQVTIAAINGWALGGGCEVALACDLRIMNDKARIGLPETGLGIIPGLGGTQRLPRLVGSSVGKQLIYTAEHIDAETALRIGLVNEITPPEEVLPAAKRLAERICRNAPIAVVQAKHAINEGLEGNLRQGMHVEMSAGILCFDSKDRTEGLTAFMEKRPPNFTGR